jgi:hypothetical protein
MGITKLKNVITIFVIVKLLAIIILSNFKFRPFLILQRWKKKTFI